MKNIIIALMIFFTGTISNVVAEENQTIVLAADYWCPYNCNPGDKNPGYLVELAEKVFDIYGIKIEYKLLPWFEALIQSKSGKVGGVIGTSSAEKGLIIPALPQAFSEIASFVRMDTDWKFDGMDSLHGEKVAIILDYNLGTLMKEFVSTNYPKKPEMFVLESGDRALIDSIKNLLSGKADVYIDDEAVVMHYIAANNLENELKPSGRIGEKAMPLYIAFASDIPKSKTYIKMLEDGMRSLNATGDLADLRKKYQIAK